MLCVYQNGFSILYPSYREIYLMTKWKLINRLMENHGLKIEIHQHSKTIIIKNSIHTKDIYFLFKGRDFIRLVVRSVPLSIAKKIFDDNLSYFILNINIFFKKEQKYNKKSINKWKKKYLTIKTLEFISKSNIIMRGNSICAIGPRKSINKLLDVIHNCHAKLDYLTLLRLFVEKNSY